MLHDKRRLLLIAGPCSLESESNCRTVATELKALAAPEEALFIECHLVFDEPQGWFNGANLIRSKVPVLVEDTVRKARRRLAKTLAE